MDVVFDWYVVVTTITNNEMYITYKKLQNNFYYTTNKMYVFRVEFNK